MSKFSSRPTIVDIARAVGVSVTTVSRALRGDPRISQATTDRILQSARAVNYRPNIMARALVNRGSSLIGFVIRHIERGFFSDIISGVQNELEKEGFSIILCNSAMNHQDESNHLRVMMDKQVEGIIVTPVSSEGINRKLYKDIVAHGIPMVMVTNPKDGVGIPYVKVDNILGGYLAGKHLLELGHRRITYISPDREKLMHHKRTLHSENIERYEGLRQACLEYGALEHLGVVEAPQEEVTPTTIAQILASDPLPTALFSYSDIMAIMTIRLLESHGYSIPGDFSVVGFDDLKIASLVNPSLTTIAQPKRELGVHAARILLSLLKNNPVEDICLNPSLVDRESTAAVV